ncbi:hypothetical protein M514_12737, partial [Trichuris suis]
WESFQRPPQGEEGKRKKKKNRIEAPPPTLLTEKPRRHYGRFGGKIKTAKHHEKSRKKRGRQRTRAWTSKNGLWALPTENQDGKTTRRTRAWIS